MLLTLSNISSFYFLFDIFDFLFDIFFENLDDIILLSTMPIAVKEGTKLHNEYVVGLCDAEATFTISITKDNRLRKK